MWGPPAWETGPPNPHRPPPRHRHARDLPPVPGLPYVDPTQGLRLLEGGDQLIEVPRGQEVELPLPDCDLLPVPSRDLPGDAPGLARPVHPPGACPARLAVGGHVVPSVGPSPQRTTGPPRAAAPPPTRRSRRGGESGSGRAGAASPGCSPCPPPRSPCPGTPPPSSTASVSP